MSYFADSTLDLYAQQAERNHDTFERLLTEMGVTIDPDLEAALEEAEDMAIAAKF